MQRIEIKHQKGRIALEKSSNSTNTDLTKKIKKAETCEAFRWRSQTFTPKIRKNMEEKNEEKQLIKKIEKGNSFVTKLPLGDRDRENKRES